ncbi:hypothetical protein TMatcc_004609 [Talaromyces marneffei ATCC 18224]
MAVILVDLGTRTESRPLALHRIVLILIDTSAGQAWGQPFLIHRNHIFQVLGVVDFHQHGGQLAH